MAERTDFGKLRDILDIPDLIGIQVDSYNELLQRSCAADSRKSQGLQEVFNEVFPIESFDQKCVLDFVRYEFSEPKEDVDECLRSGRSYTASLYVHYRLKTPKDTK